MHRCATPWQVGGKEEPSCWAEPGRRIHPLFPGECHPQNHRGSPSCLAAAAAEAAGHCTCTQIHHQHCSQNSWVEYKTLFSVPGMGWQAGGWLVWGFFPLFWWFSSPFGITACSDFDYICLVEYELTPKYYLFYGGCRSVAEGMLKPHSKFCWTNKNVTLNHEGNCENCSQLLC